MAGLAFNRIFGDDQWMGVGYRSPKSGQNELIINFTTTSDGVWQTAYTVPKGATLYITDIIFYVTTSCIWEFGYGATPVTIIYKSWSDGKWQHTNFRTVPLKFTSEELLKFKSTSITGTSSLVLVGWLE